MPFIVASAIIHIVYFILVGLLYRSADLSVAYPIMRGLAPLIAAIIALATLGEAPGPIASLGVAALVAGVLAMGASGLAHGRIDRPTILVALANSVVIAVYSVIDGQGARLSGASAAFAFAYNSWADALTALAYLPIILCLRGRATVAAFAQGWRLGLVGGGAAFLGYAIVVWAMTRAPIAAVAALRETSVVFAGDHRRRGASRTIPCATRSRRAGHPRRRHPSADRLTEGAAASVTAGIAAED